MPLTNPPASGGSGTPIGNLGIMATTPANVTSGYSWTYATQAKAFPAYVAVPVSTPYVGGLLDLSQALRLADGNALRVAVENLRVFTENLAQQHNSISVALLNAGLISTT